MNATAVIIALILIALLSLSAFFSAAETALTSITKTQARQLRKSRRRADIALSILLDDPSRMLTTLLIGTNILNILSSSIATAFAISVFGNDGLGIAMVVMTVVIIIFSEITPKTIAANNPLHVARTIEPIATGIRFVLYPLVWTLSLINSFFIFVIKLFSPSSVHQLTEEEIKTMMNIGKKEGALEEEEHSLLHRAFDFTDLTLRDIMTPRTAIVALPSDAGLESLIGAFKEHGFSRLPVYEDTIDKIKGMIHYKDLLFSLESESVQNVAHLLRPVLYVPDSQMTTELLAAMESSNQNLAIVIDEHGATAGLVTLDDAVAAVFGGIHDEYDKGISEPNELIQVINSAHIRVPGNLKLTELNALLKTTLDSVYYETVGGFVLELAGKLPSKGEQYKYENVVFVVEELAGRRIQRIDINITIHPIAPT